MYLAFHPSTNVNCHLTKTQIIKIVEGLTWWCCSQKEGVLWKQTTHTPSDVDPGVYVLQIGLTPTDSFPFPKLKLLPALPDSSMIHRLTDASTQQFNDSHFLSCTSTLMRLQKKFFILIHKICTSSTAQAILAISNWQKERRGSDRSSCTVLPLPNSSCLFLQQELNSTSDAAENSQYS
jgi:hypothetical protein